MTNTDKQERIVVRIQDELDRTVKLYSWARECLENELYEGGLTPGRKMALTDKDFKKLKELALMCEGLVSAKIRFDKAAKAMADTMSPAEERAAVVDYIKSAEPETRKEIIRVIKDWEATRFAPKEPLGNPSPAS